MNTERELIQQLRDALNEYQPCDHANTEIVSAGWHDCKQCGELIRPAHYARDREDTARVVDLIAAADAYLSKQDWIRVEDALPVVPEGFVLAPHFRGYALLGSGMYFINHSRFDAPAELIISVAREEEKRGMAVGDMTENPDGTVLMPEEMAVRIGFASEAGLRALEDQLRLLREVHFPNATPQPPEGSK